MDFILRIICFPIISEAMLEIYWVTQVWLWKLSLTLKNAKCMLTFQLRAKCTYKKKECIANNHELIPSSDLMHDKLTANKWLSSNNNSIVSLTLLSINKN